MIESSLVVLLIGKNKYVFFPIHCQNVLTTRKMVYFINVFNRDIFEKQYIWHHKISYTVMNIKFLTCIFERIYDLIFLYNKIVKLNVYIVLVLNFGHTLESPGMLWKKWPMNSQNLGVKLGIHSFEDFPKILQCSTRFENPWNKYFGFTYYVDIWECRLTLPYICVCVCVHVYSRVNT